jgi:hypothetical protein
MQGLLSSVWKALVCGLAFTLGTMLGAPIAAALGATLMAVPEGAAAATLALLAAVASIALALALGPLASGLAVGLAARWAILALLAYVCLGVNTAIEAAIFTTFGGTSGLLVLNALSCAGLAAALAIVWRPVGVVAEWPAAWRRFWSQHGAAQWAWRLIVAVMAFPLIYFLFGMMAGPFVIDAYRAGRFGLAVPSLDVILSVQLLRSALFLLASLPVVVAWGGSRRRLWLALGTAHFALVGLFGMLQAYWLPASMRLIHGTEILADSIAYAAVLVALLMRPPDSGRASASVSLAA